MGPFRLGRAQRTIRRRVAQALSKQRSPPAPTEHRRPFPFIERLYRDGDGFVALVGPPIPGTRKAGKAVVFAKQLREGVRRGRIRCSVRIWQHLHVKVGGRYPMDDGHIVVDAITRIALKDITYDLARESGFDSVKALLDVAKHGAGRNVYLIRFHYLPPGAWETPARRGTRRV